MATGRAAAFYKTPTSPELAQFTINAKLLSVLQGFEADLRAEFANYDSFPDPIKLALLDMVPGSRPLHPARACSCAQRLDEGAVP